MPGEKNPGCGWTGLELANADGTITIDPLPISLDNFALEGVGFHGQRIDVLWYNPDKLVTKKDFAQGLTVKLNGKTILYDAKFRPGNEPKHINEVRTNKTD